VAILGEAEVAEGAATVKDFRTGEQVRLPWAQVAAHLEGAD
jgi:histidyl-tRNA synthetase